MPEVFDTLRLCSQCNWLQTFIKPISKSVVVLLKPGCGWTYSIRCMIPPMPRKPDVEPARKRTNHGGLGQSNQIVHRFFFDEFRLLFPNIKEQAISTYSLGMPKTQWAAVNANLSLITDAPQECMNITSKESWKYRKGRKDFHESMSIANKCTLEQGQRITTWWEKSLMSAFVPPTMRSMCTSPPFGLASAHISNVLSICWQRKFCGRNNHNNKKFYDETFHRILSTCLLA